MLTPSSSRCLWRNQHATRSRNPFLLCQTPPSPSSGWQKEQEVELDPGKGLGALSRIPPNVMLCSAEQPVESLSRNQRAASAENHISAHSGLCPVRWGHSCTYSNTHSLQACGVTPHYRAPGDATLLEIMTTKASKSLCPL